MKKIIATDGTRMDTEKKKIELLYEETTYKIIGGRLKCTES